MDNKLREQLREYRDIYFNCGVLKTFLFRDHVIAEFDEFAIKKGYNPSSHYSKVTFSKDLMIVLNENITTGNVCSMETVQSVGATNFQKRMGISAKIINNLECKDLNLSNHLVDGPLFLEAYKNKTWDLDKLMPARKRTQYLHEVIPFQSNATPEGLEAYFSWMEKVDFIEESFSSNKNLYFQNHMILKRIEDLYKHINDWNVHMDKRLVTLERNQKELLDVLKSLKKQK